ncbi:MAG: hypothetical protein WBM00_03810, partial [Solirubrobacterales bacterium]
MSRKKLPQDNRPLASADDAAERLAKIVDAAEQAASNVIDDAERQASQHLEEAQARADRIVAERLRALADELDPPGAGGRPTPHLTAVESDSEVAAMGSGSGHSGSAGARLLATQMAMHGASRQE